nr:hypothetical protein [Actinomycetota bacterium]
MSGRLREVEAIRAERRAKVDAVRADGDLTWEAKERKIKEIGREYYAREREAEARVTEGIKANIEAAYRSEHGPAPSALTAEQETAKELRLARIRAEVADEFEAGAQDPLVSYERAVRAGDAERAEVIGKVGERYLTDRNRRARLRQLVEENRPESQKRARRERERLEGEQRSTELG